MGLKSKILLYSDLLSRRGFTEEAEQLRKMAHYIPDDSSDVPSFFRRNYDYSEGFYCGDMSEKPGVKEWREKHKDKGPNWPKKKKKETAQVRTPVKTPSNEVFWVIRTPHFLDEARKQGPDFDETCFESKLTEMFDKAAPEQTYGSHFGQSYVYFKKKYNDIRHRWELELITCTPDRRFHTTERQFAKLIDVGC